MIKITKLADYAVVLLSVMSRTSGALLSAHQLSNETHIPEPTVAKVTKRLAKAGLILSTRGVNGGYELARPIEDISILNVIESIEGTLCLTECVQYSDIQNDAQSAPPNADHGNCQYASNCPNRGRWDKVNAAIYNVLAQMPLSDMMRADYEPQALRAQAAE